MCECLWMSACQKGLDEIEPVPEACMENVKKLYSRLDCCSLVQRIDL